MDPSFEEGRENIVWLEGGFVKDGESPQMCMNYTSVGIPNLYQSPVFSLQSGELSLYNHAFKFAAVVFAVLNGMLSVYNHMLNALA